MNQTAKRIDSTTIYVYDLTQFDTDAIMHSGQVFRYFRKDNGYSFVSGNNYAEICAKDDKVIIKCNDSGYFWNYFDFDTDYNAIKRELFKYEKIRPAINAGGGIRILRAGFVETVISFIISANNNIKRFTKTLNLICKNCGEKLPDGLFAFPTQNQLSSISVEDFSRFGCGYRSPYLVQAIRQLHSLDYDILSKMPNAQLKNELLKIKGIGSKVCSCIMLFAFHRLDTAPVDTWISKALHGLNDGVAAALFDNEYAGIAQQYIFYYMQFLRKEL